MDCKNVLDYQAELARNYKYKPLPPMFSEKARNTFKESIPEGFNLDGADVGVYGPSGLKIANRYNRIVIGDYGAYVEFMPEDVIHQNIVVKKGQEYRDTDSRYSGNVKFSWLTLTDNSDIKIYYQKKPVAYADYVPGRYYVSVYECVPHKLVELEQGGVYNPNFQQAAIDGWLKDHGVYTEELSNYYFQLMPTYGSAIDCALKHNVPPYELEFWFYIHDFFSASPSAEALTYEQYQAIAYNLQVIHCTSNELCGLLDSLAPEIRVAVELGHEGLEFPYQFQNMPTETLRSLLRMPPEDLLCISKFSKVIAGSKAEKELHDVDSIISAATAQAQVAGVSEKHFEMAK